MTEVDWRARMLERVNTGEPFKTRDLIDIATAAGVQGAFSKANQLTQTLKGNRTIRVIRNEGATYVWQLSAPANADKVGKAPIPPIVAPVHQGPYDAPAALEGPNNGLTEHLGGALWRRLGGGEKGKELKDGATIMEADGWRRAAAGILTFLGRCGFTGPGGPPRSEGDWNCVFVHECNNWEIITDKGEGVALILNDTDVPLLVAAPAMRTAILAALEEFDARGAIKPSRLEALRASLPT